MLAFLIKNFGSIFLLGQRLFLYGHLNVVAERLTAHQAMLESKLQACEAVTALVGRVAGQTGFAAKALTRGREQVSILFEKVPVHKRTEFQRGLSAW